MYNMIIVLLLTCTSMTISSQEPREPLVRGNKVPDVELSVINRPKSALRLSELYGKIVILDFWATWCGSCIANFSKLEDLQKEFGDDIQIILVNSGETKEKVHDFLDKRKLDQQEIELPVAMGSEELKALFPYKFLPHYVWIDSAGKFIATTSTSFVEYDVIEKILMR